MIASLGVAGVAVVVVLVVVSPPPPCPAPRCHCHHCCRGIPRQCVAPPVERGQRPPNQQGGG
jgi:hypothetical protein